MTRTRGVNIDRNIFFDFKIDQVVNADPGLSAGIKVYNQPQGKTSGDLAYRYRDFKSYGDGTPGSAYYSDLNTPGTPVFFNPTTFQIVGPGMDGSLSDVSSPITNLANSTNVDSAQDDNITNFANGRLEQLYDE